MMSLKDTLLILVVLFVGLGAAIQTGRLEMTTRSLTKLQLEFSQAQQKAALDLAEATAKARSTEAALTEAADTSRKELNVQVTALTHQRDDLARRVRLAAASSGELRLSTLSPASSPGGPADRSDESLVLGSLGEADVDEAARADLIRTHYLACEAQYERARAALNGTDSQ